MTSQQQTTYEQRMSGLLDKMEQRFARLEKLASQSTAERPGSVSTKKDLELRTVARVHHFARLENSLTPEQKGEHGAQAGVESALCDPEGRDTLRLLAEPLKDKHFCHAFHLARNKTCLAARRYTQGLPQRSRH
jgi:hypothetical protein